jgi:hypothetical protein
MGKMSERDLILAGWGLWNLTPGEIGGRFVFDEYADISPMVWASMSNYRSLSELRKCTYLP